MRLFQAIIAPAYVWVIHTKPWKKPVFIFPHLLLGRATQIICGTATNEAEIHFFFKLKEFQTGDTADLLVKFPDAVPASFHDLLTVLNIVERLPVVNKVLYYLGTLMFDGLIDKQLLVLHSVYKQWLFVLFKTIR